MASAETTAQIQARLAAAQREQQAIDATSDRYRELEAVIDSLTQKLDKLGLSEEERAAARKKEYEAEIQLEERRQAAQQNTINQINQQTGAIKDQTNRLKDLVGLLTEDQIATKNKIQLKEKEVFYLQQEYEQKLKIQYGELEASQAQQEMLEKKRELVKLKKEERELDDKANAGAEGFATIMNVLGIKTHEQQLTLTEMFAAGAVNYEVMAKKFEDFTDSGVGFRNIMASFGAKFIESTIIMIGLLDTLRAEMFKATGGSTELTYSFMRLAETSGDTGTSFKDMNEALTGLLQTSSNFTELTDSQRESVARNNAQLVALGASTQVAGKNFSIFSQSLGMTTAQANASSRELVSLANNLNMSVAEVTDGFGQAATTVAAYGQGAVREFSKLAAESKALGLSVQELINIVKGADTFQGAAEQAGKLNAMLGGGLLNSSQLLVASESERIQLIRDAVMQTGRSFETMSKYEQIAIANAAGIQDLTVAQKLFNQQISGSELDRYLGKTNALGMSQEQMEEQAIAAKDTQEKMNILMEQFAAAMSPIVTLISSLVGFFVEYADIMKVLSVITGAYIFLMNVENMLKAKKFIINAIEMSLLNAQIGLELIQKGLTESKLLLGAKDIAMTILKTTWAGIKTAAMWAATAAQSAYNMASFRTVAIIGLVVLAFYLLYEVLHKSGSPMLYAIFGFMAIGIFFFGEALNKNKQGILAFGAAMMMVGVGAFMAFHGLEGFAIALSALDPLQLLALVIVIGLLTVALLVLFAGLGFLVYSGLGPAAAALLLAFGVSMLLAGAGALMLGIGLSMVIDSLVRLAANFAVLIMLPIFLQLMALSLIAVSVGLAIFTYTLINVGIAMIAAYIPILTVIGAITALSLAINNITPEKSIALKTTVDSIRNFVDTGRDITPETITNLDEVVKQIHKLNVEATISKAVNVTAPFKELIDAVRGQTAATAANKETTVVMKLNDREFGKAVVGVMNEYGTSNTSIRKPTPA